MKSIALVIPYFGKLPKYFDMWKMTANKNADIDFIFFSDCEGFESSANVKVYKTTFSDIVKRFKAKFGEDIVLNQPYKLCDYKPTYGYVFSEELKGYDFWGHCDIDLLFGDVRAFLTEEVLSGYDKFFEHGHLTVYRNTEENNKGFMLGTGYKNYCYYNAFRSYGTRYFDEFLGMQFISRKNGVKTYLNDNAFFDVSPYQKRFKHSNGYFTDTVFYYDGKKIFAVEKNGRKTELIYAHFQKRDIDYSAYNPEEPKDFYILPDKLVYAKDVEKKDLYKVSGERRFKIKRKIAHVKQFMRAKKESRKGFFAYKKERSLFKADMDGAKKELKKIKSEGKE